MQQSLQSTIRRVQQGRRGGALTVSLNPEFCQLTNLRKQDLLSQDILDVQGSTVLMLRKVEAVL
jgi:hypothetical protein